MFSNPVLIERIQQQLERGVAAVRGVPAATRPAHAKPLPVYDGLPVLGQLIAGTRDPLAMMSAAMRQEGDAVRIPLAIHEIILFNHPDAYERVLVRNHEAYGRGFSHKILRAIVGLGMLTAENPEWLPTRRAAAPRFTPKAVRELEPIIDEHLARWMRRWDTAARSGECRALALDFMALTSQIAWDALFGFRMSDGEAEQFTADFIAVQDDLFRRLRMPILPPRPSSFVQLRRIRRLARRLGCSADAGSLESQTMTMLATAPENPSNTLGWASYLLARHPGHAEVIREQLLSGPDSERLRDVIHETLRLYPGGWLYERTALADDVVAGYHVPRGSCLVFCPYTMHRSPAYWSDPDAFVPERFANISLRELPPYTYVPFSVGPRRCVGDRYTLQLVTQILGRFVARYRVVLDERERGEPWPMFTLRSRTGILARLERA
jgi:cytochrome P450